MSRVVTWPATLPPALEGLFDAVAERIGAEHSPIVDLAEEARRLEPGDAVVAVIDAAVAAGVDTERIMEGVLALAGTSGPTIVFVVGDGYLGTDDPAVVAPMAAAATIAATRSMAVRRGSTTRANVVCLPASFFGDAGAQFGPLAQRVEVSDAIEAVMFFLSADANYLNGQVLFVNGGRHVFSSMSA